MKALGSAISAALGAPVQQPAVLVSIAFSTPVYWSSFSTTTWSGHTWQQADLDVTDLIVQAYELSGTLTLGNRDDVAGALVLNEGVTDRAITLYGYDAAAPADVVWLATALGGATRVDAEQVVITLRHPCDGLVTPRTFVSAATFGPGLPDGAILNINGQAVRLDRRR